jgi:hypothetical protein
MLARYVKLRGMDQYLYWVIPYAHNSFIWWPIVVISAMGMQRRFNKIKP